jgi:hypothetical protein
MSRTSVTLGPIRWLQLGGGAYSTRLAALDRRRVLAVDVITAPRHSGDKIFPASAVVSS